MMDNLPRLKRRRRRWLVVGLLLFIVSVAGWWYWPRGDTRFVGKWGVYQAGNIRPVATVDLREEGRGRTTFTDNSVPMEFCWQTNGGEFVTGQRIHWQQSLFLLASRLWKASADDLLLQGRIHTLRIVEVGQDRIDFITDDDQPIVYRRLAE